MEKKTQSGFGFVGGFYFQGAFLILSAGGLVSRQGESAGQERCELVVCYSPQVPVRMSRTQLPLSSVLHAC